LNLFKNPCASAQEKPLYFNGIIFILNFYEQKAGQKQVKNPGICNQLGVAELFVFDIIKFRC